MKSWFVLAGGGGMAEEKKRRKKTEEGRSSGNVREVKKGKMKKRGS